MIGKPLGKVLVIGNSTVIATELAKILEKETVEVVSYEEEPVNVPFATSYLDYPLPPNPGVQCHRCQKYVRGGSVGTRCPFCNSVIKGMMKRGKSNKKRRR